MTLEELRRQIETSLATITEEWSYESQAILFHYLKINRLDLVINKNRPITESEVTLIQKVIERRLKREPLQYIMNSQGFMGEIFYVAEGVLIPRHDTESLVEDAVEMLKASESPYILDIGTGSGAILISLLKKLKTSTGVGVDISDLALEIATKNSELLGVEERINFKKSDLFLNVGEEMFDLIISNPPYIPNGDKKTLQPEITEYEPEIALYGGEDGYDFYKKIVPEALKHLKSGGWLMFEAGYNQADTISKMMCDNNYRNVSCFCDLRGVKRFIKGQKF